MSNKREGKLVTGLRIRLERAVIGLKTKQRTCQIEMMSETRQAALRNGLRKSSIRLLVGVMLTDMQETSSKKTTKDFRVKDCPEAMTEIMKEAERETTKGITREIMKEITVEAKREAANQEMTEKTEGLLILTMMMMKNLGPTKPFILQEMLETKLQSTSQMIL